MKKKKIRRKNIFICFVGILLLVIILILLTNKQEEKQEETIETFSSSTDNVMVVEVKKPEIASKTTDWDLILVNKENEIPEDYQVELQTVEGNNKVDIRIVEALTQMLADARKEGLQPYICSSYRTNQKQITLFNRKVNQYQRLGYSKQQAEEEASYWVTFPRTSEHELGLSVDIVSKSYQILDEKQEDTPVQKWLMENCDKYGFTLRYPTYKKEITKINYEPWHYRYVGIENAKFMKEKDYCLEEYIAYLKEYEEDKITFQGENNTTKLTSYNEV